jgi:hypothetical protein
MSRSLERWMICGIALVLASMPLTGARAQVGGPYDLSWSVIDCGGGPTAGGALDLFTSIGQPEIGSSSGGAYTIEGGFEQQGTGTTDAPDARIPIALDLEPARPNPTTAGTAISYALPEEAHVRIRIFAADGTLVRELLDAACAAGLHTTDWNGRDMTARPVPAGVYFVRLESADKVRTRKIVIAR